MAGPREAKEAIAEGQPLPDPEPAWQREALVVVVGVAILGNDARPRWQDTPMLPGVPQLAAPEED